MLRFDEFITPVAYSVQPSAFSSVKVLLPFLPTQLLSGNLCSRYFFFFEFKFDVNNGLSESISLADRCQKVVPNPEENENKAHFNPVVFAFCCCRIL